jgi:hypothetical protein
LRQRHFRESRVERRGKSSQLAFQLKVESVILPQNEIIGRDPGADIIFGHDRATIEEWV